MHRQSAPSCSVRGFQGQTALAALEASCAAKPRESFQKQLERAKRKAFHYLSQNLKEDYCNAFIRHPSDFTAHSKQYKELFLGQHLLQFFDGNHPISQSRLHKEN